jgi:hypothetical protein
VVGGQERVWSYILSVIALCYLHSFSLVDSGSVLHNSPIGKNWQIAKGIKLENNVFPPFFNLILVRRKNSCMCLFSQPLQS